MKILITGATGFIGRNLCEYLETQGEHVIFKANSSSSERELDDYLHQCDFVYHLAATHRPQNSSEFQEINVRYFQHILETLEKCNSCPVAFTSSIQAGNGSGYGDSKIEAEKILKEYSKKTGAIIHILRLTNIFGKFAKVNHTSVVATFCYNISHNLPIVINNPDAILRLGHVSDVVKEMIGLLDKKESTENFLDEKYIHETTVGQLAKDIYDFSDDGGAYSEEKSYRCFLKETFNWYSSL